VRIRVLSTVILIATLGLTACGGDGSEEGKDSTKSSSDSTQSASEGYCADATDLLAEICDKGKITVSTDPGVPAAVFAQRPDR
jgi:hypothetical protein